MRKSFVRTWCVVVLLSFVGVATAAPFVNLDFEQSTVQPGDPPVVPAAAAFPGWTARFDDLPTSSVYHDVAGAGEPAIAIYDRPAFGNSIPVLQGGFMAIVVAGTSDTRSSLGQVGDVPVDSRSLTFLCTAGLPPILRINGAEVPTRYISGLPFGNEPNTYGADVSMWAGQTVDLRFEAAHFMPGGGLGTRVFDDAHFSSEYLPEPCTWGLLLCGAWMAASRELLRKGMRNGNDTHARSSGRGT